MTVHIGEMNTTVDVEPEVGSAPGPAASSGQPTPCPSRAAWELRRRMAIDVARTDADGYVD
jgi:hypothetical protein